jgi:hypothetical protein
MGEACSRGPGCTEPELLRRQLAEEASGERGGCTLRFCRKIFDGLNPARRTELTYRASE